MDRVDASSRPIAVRPHSPPRRLRDDDLPVRSRRMSLDPGDPLSRRPLSIMPPRSPNRAPRPVITKDPDGPSSLISKTSKLGGGGVQEVASYLIPASSASGRHHHRHSSLTTGDRLRPIERDSREKTYPGGTSRSSALRPSREDDRDYNYEYTGPKKEFLRDGLSGALPRTRERRDSHNIGRERPSSMILPERLETEYPRSRDPGPPPSTRGSEELGRAESLKLRRRAKDDELNRRDIPVRAYVRDDHRDDRSYQDPRRPSRRGTDDDYVPYPDANPRHHRPRKPDLDDERLEPRPRPRKQHPDDNADGRIDMRSRDHEDKYARGAEERRRPYQDDRGGVRDRDHRREFDDKGNRDRRPREEPLDNHEKGEDDHKGGIIAAGAATAVAAGAAGLAAEGGRRHRAKESDEREAPTRSTKAHLETPVDRDSENTSISGETHLSGAPEDEERRERRRRRHHEKDREDREHDTREHDRRQSDNAQEDIQLQSEHDRQNVTRDLMPSTVIPPGNSGDSTLPEQKSYERPDPNPSMHEHRQHRHRRHRRHHSHSRDDDSYSSSSSPSSEESDDEEDDEMPRQRPRVVTPSNELAKAPLPPPPPKGILKKAKDKFPEPPNPVREGVAPLDAAKKGIPPEARWTRINRRLVNPEALEQEGVRFEEYPDYVIVLKVLDQEEINKFAHKTHEIREKRRALMGAPPVTEGESDRS